jgi:catechol 2,3-dioxygenase-like lactoylglutathione lyase family enzyme
MPLSTGFNHVEITSCDVDRIVAFYEAVFEAKVTLDLDACERHPRFLVLDLGGGSSLNLVEQPAESIVGDRASQWGRGAIDHYSISVASREDLEKLRDRLAAAGSRMEALVRLDVMGIWSMFFWDPDGMQVEVNAPLDPASGSSAPARPVRVDPGTS